AKILQRAGPILSQMPCRLSLLLFNERLYKGSHLGLRFLRQFLKHLIERFYFSGHSVFQTETAQATLVYCDFLKLARTPIIEVSEPEAIRSEERRVGKEGRARWWMAG